MGGGILQAIVAVWWISTGVFGIVVGVCLVVCDVEVVGSNRSSISFAKQLKVLLELIVPVLAQSVFY